MQTVPDQFAQLYMIFGSGGAPSEKIYPAVYMLLPSKSATVYTHAFKLVKDAVGTSPESVSIDFEAAVIKASTAVFPNLKEIVGCRFHRKKNLFFQVGQKGCLSLYHGDEAFQVGLELVYTMDKLPVNEVIVGWEQVVLPHFQANFGEDNESVNAFLAYVERNYVLRINARTGESTPATFPPAIWANYERFMNLLRSQPWKERKGSGKAG